MEKKKVVILGGGTGLSFLLKGLKMYPLDITACPFKSLLVLNL